ncbi:hypothetical protein BN1723_012019 [Verticillium longisporum]|uniref:Fungal N-terminal domain-containing protein n=1 Tax=Verticillium longisporum TaxID=100787 RepID=A0A0G4LD98_VERLO|nr:hypothetical protein BN1723_012019 [Verticillium longisporum]
MKRTRGKGSRSGNCTSGVVAPQDIRTTHCKLQQMVVDKQITKSLYKLAKSYRTVEVRIVGLCEELTNLTNFLNTVDKTLRRYGTLDFALVEKELWREIDQSLVNCELSLNDLKKLVERIKRHAHTKGFAWKTRTVADLAVYDGELAAFRDKIHKSNWALQTILSTINVSLSLRSNTSQAKILTELSTLKLSIEEALRVSRLPVGGFSQHFTSLPDARLAQNLWHLAEAAKQFHSAASSTASTVRADDSNASVRQLSRTGSSLAGDFPPIRRHWVEQCLRQGRCQSPEFATPVLSKARTNPEEISDQKKWTSDSPTLASDSAPQVVEQRRSDEDTEEEEEEEEEEDDGEDCSDIDQYYISGLYELANESIKALDFANAARLLSRFLSKATASTEAGVANKPTRTTKIQLAICHFLEGSWQKAAPLVTELARSKAGRNMVVCNLLHALAIAHLAQGKTDEALATCQQAFLGKKRLWKKQDTDEYSAEYYASLGLLHVVFDASDDPIRAEIFKRQLPADFDYHHFPDPRLFVAQHQTLLRALFLLPPGETATPLVFEGSPEPGKRVRGSRRGGSSQDVSTIETEAIPFRGDADDELSPISPQAVKRGINRIFGRMIRRTSREALDSPGSPKPDSFHSNGLTRHRAKPANTWTNTKKLRTVLKKRQVVNPPQWRRQDSAEGESSGGESTPLQDDAAFTTTGRFFFAGDEQRGAPVFRAELADTSRPPELGCMATIPAKALEEPSWQAYNPYRKLKASRSIRKAKSKPKPAVQLQPSPTSGSAPMQRSLEQVASAFASIAAAKDPDHRHAIRLELEILSRDLAATSNDVQLLRDIDNAIKSISSKEATKDADIEDSGYESAESSSPQKLAEPEADDFYSSTPAREKGFNRDVPQLPQPVPFAKTGPPSSPAQPTANTWSPGLTRSREPPPSTRPTTDLWNSAFMQSKEPERTFKGPMEEYATKSTITNFRTLDELARSYEKPRRAPDIYSQGGNGAQQRSWMQFSARYLPGANRGGSRTPIGALYPNLRRPCS